MNLRSVLGSWYAPLLIHAQNQNQAAMRAASAKAQGLDPTMYGTPFPGGNVTTTNNTLSRGWVIGPILTVGALIIGAGMSVYLLQAAKGPAPLPEPKTSIVQPATQPTKAPDPKPGKDPAWDEITEEQQPDGTWKLVPGSRRHMERQPDGSYR